eukprot:TRINITY_DN16352_c0_g1_i1.p1 TRINITY_DN16352_c0_g1~~TRINITY_DN16352_c0_g1_i1.p1  ORF type:complete len:119 (-),score=20.61 TRINITY_DN16352_c0_g1_i1:101-457(-)
MKEDWQEIVGAGGRGGPQIYAKEKGSSKWRPAIYMPTGELTAIAVRFWRSTTTAGLVFGGDSPHYEEIKTLIRGLIPDEAGLWWTHSVKRGAAQEIELGRKSFRTCFATRASTSRRGT